MVELKVEGINPRKLRMGPRPLITKEELLPPIIPLIRKGY